MKKSITTHHLLHLRFSCENKTNEPENNNAIVCTMCASMKDKENTLRMQKLCTFAILVSNDSSLHAGNSAEWRYHRFCTKRSNPAC